MGDRLVVSVTDDAHINKPDWPIFNRHERAGIIAALRCVDQVIIVSGLMQAMELVQPQIVVKGSDYTELEPPHAKYCRDHGIEVKFTDTPKYSSTEILDAIKRRS